MCLVRYKEFFTFDFERLEIVLAIPGGSLRLKCTVYMFQVFGRSIIRSSLYIKGCVHYGPFINCVTQICPFFDTLPPAGRFVTKPYPPSQIT